MGPSEAVLLGLLLGALGMAACWSHSLRYFVTGMTDPGPGMPRFVIVGYVDGDLFGKYDSKIKSAQPIVEKLPQEDQEHWAAQTQKARGGERDFDWFLSRLPERYNKSKGLTRCRRCLAVTSWRTAASEGTISMHLMGGTSLPLIWTR
nr:major histocompatibility complex y class I heavy chain [Gallus gallus]